MASQYTFNGVSLDDPGGRWAVDREWMGRASSVLRVGCGLARTMCDRGLWWRLSTI